MHDYDLGIIGGGAAGLTAASGAAQLGVKTVLFEAESALGGDCLHYGCVPSKTLLHTAKVRHLMATAREYGLPEACLPPVEFSRVAERIAEVVAAIQRHDSPERFCKLGAQVEFARAAFVDEHTVEATNHKGSRRVSAARWLIATGSSAAVPPIPGLAETDFLTNRDLFSLPRLPESLIILGGGAIAVEMAQAFNRLGSRVHIIQRSPHILSREDEDMAQEVQAVLQAEGVTLHTGASVQEVHSANGRCEARIAAHGGEKLICAERILVALGRKANLDGLGLDQAGVEVAGRGVKVDSRLRTSRSHIYAAGDATGSHQFTHAAGYEGGVVVTNAVFRLPRSADYTWMPRCTYCDPELACAGMTERDASGAGIDYSLHVEEFKDNDRALAEGATHGKLKLLLDGKGKPLGVQILGSRAGDILGEWVAALNAGIKLSSLASAVHPYPTLAEINKRAAGNVLAPKIFSDKVRKGLKFFFDYKGRACEYGEGYDTGK